MVPVRVLDAPENPFDSDVGEYFFPSTIVHVDFIKLGVIEEVEVLQVFVEGEADFIDGLEEVVGAEFKSKAELIIFQLRPLFLVHFFNGFVKRDEFGVFMIHELSKFIQCIHVCDEVVHGVIVDDVVDGFSICICVLLGLRYVIDPEVKHMIFDGVRELDVAFCDGGAKSGASVEVVPHFCFVRGVIVTPGACVVFILVLLETH